MNILFSHKAKCFHHSHHYNSSNIYEGDYFKHALDTLTETSDVGLCTVIFDLLSDNKT